MTTPLTAPTLRELLSARVEATPDRLAYADAERSITYAELDRASAELAAGLQAEGVQPGDRVAISMSAGVSFAELFWATQRLGAAPCALNPMAPPETIARRAERIRPRLLVDDATAHALRRPGATADEADVVGGDLAYLQPTSGTSGDPRTAMVTQKNVLTYLGLEALGASATGHVLVTWVPHWHDLGLVDFCIRPVHRGCPCHIVRPAVSTIPLWFETIAAVGGTVTGAPDFALRLAVRLVDPRRVDLSSLRFVTNGGEPVRSTTIAAFEEHVGKPGCVLPGYGLAEATLGVSARRAEDPARIDAHGHVSCGPPLDILEVRAGHTPEEPAEILVRGDTVFAGYLDDEEGTAEVLRDGWLHTGDLGYLDADGYLYVLGRERAILKRGGALLAPRELEEAALSVAGVRQAAAVGLRSEGASTEEIAVVVEAKPEESGPAETVRLSVADALRRALGFVPERVVVVPPRSIPLTANGKVRHAVLAELLAQGGLG